MKNVKLITRDQFRDKLGVSRTTFWRYQRKEENFPKPISFGGGREFWLDHATDEFILVKAARTKLAKRP